MAFDPDAYLARGPAPVAQATPTAFDPDAYLAPKPEAPFSERAGTAVRKFFDPGYGSQEPAGLRNVARQAVKAGAFLVPGSGAASLLAGGALFGAGDSEATDVPGVAWDAAKGAAGALVGGKVLQKVGGALVNATAWPAGRGAAIAQEAYNASRQPVIKVLKNASGVSTAPVANAAATALTTEPAVGAFPKLVAGEVTPSKSAQTLMGSGVRLTRGQQDPAGSVNQLEEAMTSTWPYGTKIKAQRGIGQGDLQVAALNQAVPPGMKKIPIGTEFTTAVDSVDKGFSKAYGAVADVPVYPAVHGAGGGPLQGTSQTPGLVERAVDSIGRLQDTQRAAIKRDVLDVLTKLPPRKGAVGQVDASDLIEARSIIRSRARELWEDGTAESSAAAEAYEAAEGAVTAALESQLPRNLVTTLRNTDKAYGKFKTVQRAIMMGKSQPGGFTARQLANAASAGQSGVNVGRQTLGPLYDLGLAGSDVFQRVSQPTGERVVTLAQAGQFLPGWLQRPLQGAALARGNEQAMRAAPVTIPLRMRPLASNAGAVPGAPGPGPGAAYPAAVDPMQALVRAMENMGIRVVPAGADEGRENR